tara:strand:- start:232 stop:2094 length:1863 start_codon:yes stop_codon:yes gene_type:complete
MKQFKGGLYANLGNYKSSLPQTKILNNFFNQNPVGYKKGGEVKGIKGVNYSRIPVTGGFMANAQGFQNGGSVSAFYGKRGQAIRPGRLEAPYIGTLRTRGDDVITESMLPPIDRAMIGKTGLFGMYPPATDEDFISAGAKPTEFSTARESYIASQPELGEISKEKRKEERKRKNIADLNKSSREKYDEMFGEDFGVGGINSLIDDKKQKKSKLKDADEIKADVDVNYEDASGITGIREIEKPDTSKIDTDLGTSDVKAKLDEEGVFKTKDKDTLLEEMFDGSKFDKILNKQEELTKSSIDAINRIGKPFYDKDGEDAPEWAMPLMMAGLKMAASDNPSLLGALAEGGISGMEEYAKKQAQKREDAKDQIALEMQKMNAIINLQSKDIDVATDFAKVESNVNTKAFELAYDDYSKQKDMIFKAILKDADFDMESQKFKTQSEIALLELDQRYDIAIAQLDKDYQILLDRRSEFKSEIEFKNKQLEIESVKIYNENIKHENLLELEKVTEGKVTTIFMPDADGNMKEYRVRNYYDFDKGEFETDIIGIAPPDQDVIDDLSVRIKEEILNSKTVTIGGETFDVSTMLQDGDFLAIEDLVSKKVEQVIKDKYSTGDDVRDALEE